MIRAIEPAPLRRIRLNRRNHANSYELKVRFATLCEEHAISLISVAPKTTVVWSVEANCRRCLLIDKSLQGELSATEQRELSRLQRQAEAYFDEIAPPPIDGALKLHAKLLSLSKAASE